MKLDGTALQILANYAASAAEAMAYTLMRTAHSTFVKETEDFSCGLLTPEGLTFASPLALGATWYVGLDYGPAVAAIKDYREGDICITNDPYSGFVATHTPDIHIWKPVFHQGEVVAFAAGHIHNTDMGGAVPASLSRTLYEVHQEGIRVPPTKLVSDGVLDERLVDMLGINVRLPEQNWGDLNAQIASVNTGERKILEMIERFGPETFRAGIAQLMDYAEAQARAILRAIPDGEYFFADYADEDSDGEGKPCRIAVTLRIKGDLAELDFTGSDPQLRSSLNVPTGGRERHVLPLVAFVYVLHTLNPRLAMNAGLLRSVRAILPEGTVVNPKHPAAVGMRSLTCVTIMQAIFGAFVQALPEQLAASPAGGLAIINIKTMTRDGRTVMASMGPVGGGAGGNIVQDGTEASGANTCFLRNTPVEIIEAEIPVRMRRYGLAPDTGGAGRFRGGSATLMEFQVFAPDTVVTARNRDRSRFAAWGVQGGGAGVPSRFTRNPGRNDQVELGNADIVPLKPGDVLRVQGPGGGGHGPAHRRDPALVLKDVRGGFVSTAAARQLYGVAITKGAIDQAETARLRAAMEAAWAGPIGFDYGPARTEYESVMTRERYDALTRILAAAPVEWRFYLKHHILDRLFAEGAALPAGPAAIHALYAGLRKEFPILPQVA
ncbi:MAG: hydantoinase B/oxoprolinase family protein [Acetobacteraceae bacterium]|nr:hydantoinase B/oxoprolinase family protein [Acetobacteraceae bacterium]